VADNNGIIEISHLVSTFSPESSAVLEHVEEAYAILFGVGLSTAPDGTIINDPT
jgi:hypothetical protein